MLRRRAEYEPIGSLLGGSEGAAAERQAARARFPRAARRAPERLPRAVSRESSRRARGHRDSNRVTAHSCAAAGASRRLGFNIVYRTSDAGVMSIKLGAAPVTQNARCH